MGASDLAELLRSLKERSGLSYGVLAKRLHVSTSTLHRYCNGSTVPTEFAPVERLARLCKATPEELIQVHRQWILADAARGRKPSADGASTDVTPAEVAAPAEEATTAPVPEVMPDPPRSAPPISSDSRPPRERRTRRAVLAALAVTCVMGSAALAASLVSNSTDDDGKAHTAAASSSNRAAATAPGKPGKSGQHPSGTPSSSPKEEKDGKEKEKERGEPAASAGSDDDASPSAPGQQEDSDSVRGDAPLTAHTRPYAYESPCSQRFLVNRKPGEMPKPPFEQDAPAWVSELGAVSADQQFVKITLQGTGKDAVVLEGLHARVDSTQAPLAWNAYATGVGCGGDVATRSFGVDLGAGSPTLTPVGGQRDFPYKVSRTDAEVFYVKADVGQHDVRWHLELQWSSGGRHGTLRIDDQGRPFRTSGSAGRPSYQQPPGDTRWSPAPVG
ncbi:helix-turn-helix domain-containing protein [Streptomyces syringium]|uniref:helix-turn-helix domain-containing protein n=1 Tax=Streptomyces syringium TaxID=76729 RepID=UPI0037D8A3EE